EHARPTALVLRARLLPALAEPLPAGVLQLDDRRAAVRPEADLDLRLRRSLFVAGVPGEGDPRGRLPGEDLAPHSLLAARRPLDDPVGFERDTCGALAAAAVALQR